MRQRPDPLIVAAYVIAFVFAVAAWGGVIALIAWLLPHR